MAATDAALFTGALQSDGELVTSVNAVIGGLGGCVEGYKELCAKMAKHSNRLTFAIGSVRWGKMWHGRRRKLYPRSLYRQACHVAEQLRELVKNGVTEIHLYGHSFGGLVAMVAADLFTEFRGIIKRIVLINAGGIFVDGLALLAGRVIRKMMLDTRESRKNRDPNMLAIARAGRAGAVHYLSNPVRTIAEILTVSRCTLFPGLYARLQEAGIPVMIAVGEHDLLFPAAWAYRAATRVATSANVRILRAVRHEAQYYPDTLVRSLQRFSLL